jgi:hypothetical protein
MSSILSSNTPMRPSIQALAKEADYAPRAMAAIAQISLATNPPTLLKKLADAKAIIGASASLYTCTEPDGELDHACFNLFDGHPCYAVAQRALGPLSSHPWFRFARMHLTSGSDRQILAEASADAAAIALAQQYGFRACFIVPTTSGLGRPGMLCLGSEHPDDFEGPDAAIIRTLARALAAEVHDWLTGYFRKRFLDAARLEKDDVRLLGLQWKGLSTKEISTLTGLSNAAVDSRFQRINMRLQCSNRRASAARAAAYGLLHALP